MADYFEAEHVDDEDLSPEYRELEEQYRAAAGPLWGEARKIAESVRANVDAERERRDENYVSRFSASVNAPWQQLASNFVAAIETQRHNDRKTVEASRGNRFADHLIAVSSAPEDGLEDLMRTAQRTGQKDLARAVAQVALDKNRFQVFDRWASSEPETAEAMRRLRSTPSSEQLITRTNALKPPAATPEALIPREEDHRRAEETKRAAERQRWQSFSMGLRSVTASGSRPIPDPPRG